MLGDTLIDAVREERRRVSAGGGPSQQNSAEQLARLGSPLSAMARDLADARRELGRLRRENAALQRRVDALLLPDESPAGDLGQQATSAFGLPGRRPERGGFNGRAGVPP